MADRREEILAQLFVVCETVMGAEGGFAFRNKTEIPETKRPAVTILDADETADEGDIGRKRPASAPRRISLTPEIYVMLGDDSDTVGTTLNALRVKLLKAILTDVSLVALCQDGEIRYEGFATGFAAGRSMEGEAQINFSFLYVLRPEQL